MNLNRCHSLTRVSQVAQWQKIHLPMQEMQELQVQPLSWEDPLESGNGNPLQYPCLEKLNGQRSLTGYSPWGLKELDMTEQACRHSLTKFALAGLKPC